MNFQWLDAFVIKPVKGETNESFIFMRFCPRIFIGMPSAHETSAQW